MHEKLAKASSLFPFETLVWDSVFYYFDFAWLQIHVNLNQLIVILDATCSLLAEHNPN